MLCSPTAYADRVFEEEGWHHVTGGGLFMWLLWMLVFGVIIYFLVDYSKKQRPDNEETPLDILLRRYAKGEISREEFEQMKQDLKN